MWLRPSDRVEFRRNRYKLAVDEEEGRRRREDNIVVIRKNLREESLQKKRREGFAHSETSIVLDRPVHLDNLRSMVFKIGINDDNAQLEATIQFRILLSTEPTPIQEVIQADVVPRFVEFLTRDDFPQLQHEAAWALTNIASGTSEQTKVVIDHGAVPIFVKLLSSSIDVIRDQVVWGLGNIAGDSPECRDLVLGYGAMSTLLSLLDASSPLSTIRNAVWTLSNFCRGKPQPDFKHTQLALPILKQLIELSDEETLSDACWTLSYLADNESDKIQVIVNSGLCPRLVELLLHPSTKVLVPAIRAVGNIVMGDYMPTQCIINCNALPSLSSLLHRSNKYKKSIIKEVCWTISNITAGNTDQIQAVIEAGLIGRLVELLQDAEFDIQKEAAWAISNATSNGTHDQIKFLVDQWCIKPLCNMLACPEPKIIMVCLDGLGNILKAGEVENNLGRTGKVNLYARKIKEAKGLEKIESLQSHDNKEIYEKVVKIIETYNWLEEEDKHSSQPEDGLKFGGTEVSLPSGGFSFRDGFKERRLWSKIKIVNIFKFKFLKNLRFTSSKRKI